jgi:hypothetical protein
MRNAGAAGAFAQREAFDPALGEQSLRSDHQRA